MLQYLGKLPEWTLRSALCKTSCYTGSQPRIWALRIQLSEILPPSAFGTRSSKQGVTTPSTSPSLRNYNWIDGNVISRTTVLFKLV